MCILSCVSGTVYEGGILSFRYYAKDLLSESMEASGRGEGWKTAHYCCDSMGLSPLVRLGSAQKALQHILHIEHWRLFEQYGNDLTILDAIGVVCSVKISE